MGSVPTTVREPRRGTPAPAGVTANAPPSLWQSTLVLALLGQALYWAALPPLAWAPLAWIAPVAWIWLIRRDTLTGRRPYLALWLASFAFHLAVLYWVTLPHPATSIGWVALSGYLALYFPAFVAMSRVAVHRLGISSIVAAPVVWTGLELARAHLLSGFGMASLAHTQYRWPLVLQISDLFGSYGVSFLIVLTAACLARMIPCERTPRAWWPVAPLAAALAGAIVYGHWRLNEDSTRPGPNVALIQGSIDIDMKHDPNRADQILSHYYELSRRAVREHADLDLIVWPETMFRDPWFTFADDFQPPDDAAWTPEEAEAASRRNVRQLVRSLDVPCLIGIDTLHYRPGAVDYFNSALLADREGNVLGRYDKCHRVPFGEYVFLGDVFPWLYKLTPLPRGANAGAGPRSIQLAGVRYAPNICYENTLPHLIRRQVARLCAAGEEPDVLVNLTNDGWFWGSSALDLHLACAVFRAIETRKPLVIAANTGFSASIDASGRILHQGPRRAPDVLVDRVRLDTRRSPYLRFGDLAAALCLLATIGVGVAGLWTVRSDRQQQSVR